MRVLLDQDQETFPAFGGLSNLNENTCLQAARGNSGKHEHVTISEPVDVIVFMKERRILMLCSLLEETIENDFYLVLSEACWSKCFSFVTESSSKRLIIRALTWPLLWSRF